MIIDYNRELKDPKTTHKARQGHQAVRSPPKIGQSQSKIKNLNV